MKKLFNYIKESIGELKRVSWPSKDEIVVSTIIIIVFIVIMTIFLGAVDISASSGIKALLDPNLYM